MSINNSFISLRSLCFIKNVPRDFQVTTRSRDLKIHKDFRGRIFPHKYRLFYCKFFIHRQLVYHPYSVDLRKDLITNLCLDKSLFRNSY